jgi:hypothetical protein
MVIDSNNRSLIDKKMASKERVFIAPEGDPYNGFGERRVCRLSFRVKDTFQNVMIEFILVKEHEFEIIKIANIRKCFEIVFGEIEFDKVGAPP